MTNLKISFILKYTYVTTGEVTALKHELRDDTVEGRALVAETLLAGAESSEVLSRLGDYIVEEVEVDTTGLLCNGKYLLATI